MTEKRYDSLQEKYKNNVFQILKYEKRKAILILIRQLGKTYAGWCNYLEIRS